MFKSFLPEIRLYLCNEWLGKFPSHRVRNWYYRKIMGFNIGTDSSLHMHTTFDCAKGLDIGNNSVINSKCRLDNRGGIVIGDNVSISQEVVILTADHDMNTPDFAGRNRKVVIEDYVWIGTRAMILPGVKIGKGAVVAAGTIVTKDVNPFDVVGGIPAKGIGKRNVKLEYQLSYRRLFQ